MQEITHLRSSLSCIRFGLLDLLLQWRELFKNLKAVVKVFEEMHLS